MPRLLVATTNQGKLREIRGLLAGAPVDLYSLADLPPVVDPEETGTTFEANARLKAIAYAAHAEASPLGQTPCTGGPLLTVAEDSGLEIDALGGEPGIYSARFVRPDATYPERFAEIYRRLTGMPHPWTARFVCALSVVQHGQPLFETRATVEGEIAPAPVGGAGFGYDPIFFFPPYGRTLAEVPEAEKLAVAHRGKAFRALALWLLKAHPG